MKKTMCPMGLLITTAKQIKRYDMKAHKKIIASFAGLAVVLLLSGCPFMSLRPAGYASVSISAQRAMSGSAVGQSSTATFGFRGDVTRIDVVIYQDQGTRTGIDDLPVLGRVALEAPNWDGVVENIPTMTPILLVASAYGPAGKYVKDNTRLDFDGDEWDDLKSDDEVAIFVGRSQRTIRSGAARVNFILRQNLSGQLDFPQVPRIDTVLGQRGFLSSQDQEGTGFRNHEVVVLDKLTGVVLGNKSSAPGVSGSQVRVHLEPYEDIQNDPRWWFRIVDESRRSRADDSFDQAFGYVDFTQDHEEIVHAHFYYNFVEQPIFFVDGAGNSLPVIKLDDGDCEITHQPDKACFTIGTYNEDGIPVPAFGGTDLKHMTAVSFSSDARFIYPDYIDELKFHVYYEGKEASIVYNYGGHFTGSGLSVDGIVFNDSDGDPITSFVDADDVLLEYYPTGGNGSDRVRVLRANRNFEPLWHAQGFGNYTLEVINARHEITRVPIRPTNAGRALFNAVPPPNVTVDVSQSANGIFEYTARVIGDQEDADNTRFVWIVVNDVEDPALSYTLYGDLEGKLNGADIGDLVTQLNRELLDPDYDAELEYSELAKIVATEPLTDAKRINGTSGENVPAYFGIQARVPEVLRFSDSDAYFDLGANARIFLIGLNSSFEHQNDGSGRAYFVGNFRPVQTTVYFDCLIEGGMEVCEDADGNQPTQSSLSSFLRSSPFRW